MEEKPPRRAPRAVAEATASTQAVTESAPSPGPLKPARFIADKEVCHRLGFGRTTLWRLRSNSPGFPQLREAAPGIFRTLEADLDEYIRTRPVARRQQSAHVRSDGQ